MNHCGSRLKEAQSTLDNNTKLSAAEKSQFQKNGKEAIGHLNKIKQGDHLGLAYKRANANNKNKAKAELLKNQ